MKKEERKLWEYWEVCGCMIVTAVPAYAQEQEQGLPSTNEILRILCWQRQPGRTERRPMWRIT